jgi:hypothetical protein
MAKRTEPMNTALSVMRPTKMMRLEAARPRQNDLLRVPLEIRREIYRYFLVYPEPIRVQSLDVSRDPWSDDYYQYLGRDRHTAVLQVSRQISEESLDLLYGENFFEVILGDEYENVLSRFAPANMERIRRVQLVLSPSGCSLPLQLGLQLPVLTHLTKLRIVAQHPLELADGRNTSFKQAMNNWLTWVRSVLAFISKYIPVGIDIKIDDNEMEETETLIKKCLFSNYQKIHTLTGDLYFKRGDLSDYSPVPWSSSPPLSPSDRGQ